MRELYAEDCRKWESLIRKANLARYRGCFTCRFYRPLSCEFVDVAEVDGDPLPWDTERAFVSCALVPDFDEILRINCKRWQLKNG
ncbi:MAG: hypothetical protein UU73_C0003G0034 [Candidatus Daviesbacteria bacterium GW2011_GWA1_41_61]|uniref:Uncharacterized protein n=1 Tax=Candidatus Daviesbacteria bacterium GW2011_GWA2_40_9 TaxID=1618424 RepID=A0A0G0U2E7_9BACT|nr:MAG: hypothetical protein UU26_C0005G0022 [Candidatus Daviesbacteria bacterium GW2011_GWC1_40_9]KKR83269.1 MAG: hypothetical protein UU29_C0007G0139 [Candidatus Daviesbacteria bacterium GW2011_GWA2_40_9]KKR93614.1 MAG: hypothetical protein UU44_C0002G0275 [Candidatus Daviesbacteria bacterium GW2011_GWB1_41_15]KKS14835.1 MAG: hypothetical protein UU73_C0003G0034 [Candidatus Daviesbacteria bacterium GW2011_GWA1_41_61]